MVPDEHFYFGGGFDHFSTGDKATVPTPRNETRAPDCSAPKPCIDEVLGIVRSSGGATRQTLCAALACQSEACSRALDVCLSELQEQFILYVEEGVYKCL